MDPASIAALTTAVAVSGSSSDSLLSGIVAQLWSYVNVALAKSVKEIVEPIFKESLPGPLSSLHFTELDLGTVPIQIDNVVVHETKNGVLQFDIDVVWDGDCSIELAADYIGSFGVQKIKFHGRVSVLMAPLMDTLPVVSAIQYGFINPPLLELDFTGLANLADCGVVDRKIRNIIQDVLAGMMVLPNRMIVKLDPANSFLDTYRPPVGVVRITLKQGKGFEAAKKSFLLRDVSDVYCHISLGTSPAWQSSTKNNSVAPVWNERKDFVLFDHDQVIQVRAWDKDVDGDDDLGSAKVTVREILLAGKTITLDLHGGAYEGASITLHCDLCSLAPAVVEDDDDDSPKDDDNVIAGLVTILVTKAFDIPLAKEEASCFVKVKYGAVHEFVTGKVVDAPGADALNPVFDRAFRVPLSHKLLERKESIEFQLMHGEDSCLGSFTISHDELMNAENMTITVQPKIGEEGASLEVRASLGLVQPPSVAPRSEHLTGSSCGSGALGVVRLTVGKGWGFKVEKRGPFKKKDVPDCYVCTTFGSSPNIWRTPTDSNTTTPEWNATQDYALENHGQIVAITVFDADKGKRDKDDELGGARIKVGQLLLASDMVDVELQNDGKPTGYYVSLRCDKI